MQEVRKCTICSKNFKTSTKYRIYCYKCSILPNKNTIRTSNCLYCNKEFQHKASHTKYCSKNCCQMIRYNKYKDCLIKRRSSIKQTLKYVYCNAKSRAKKKNKHFDITLDFLYSLLEKQEYKCLMTGIPLEASRGGKEPYVVSIDRIDSSKGYTKDNIALVSTIYNICKNKYTIDNVVKMCKGFIKTNNIDIND